ncbi:hypothetical protein [Paremcibacter congregatus]|uniref:GntR family transcriptional regulator n=1 Tax=Paremcibacter congregatus TaxID=2043170 RepID=A0A2G4YMP4_9PROT|nr:hypothetical protein [Paremcibacter congregatus]PHZ83563.1 hypothetical protein CRD36_16490 [Paremcibacter congregatus]QDE28351.1 hypothetical protein FIV45_14280 [Paremcibacter congregatus]
MTQDAEDITEGRGSSVYEQVRELVQTHGLPPQTHLMVEHIAIILDPCPRQEIYQALWRLVQEGVVVERPESGFFTRHFSNVEVCTLYEENKVLLDRSLEILEAHDVANGVVQYPQLFVAREDKAEKAGATGGPLSQKDLVRITGELFLHIVTQAGRSDFTEMVVMINQRLSYIRLCECTLIEAVDEEVAHLCHLYHRNEIGKLRDAVAQYHLTRFKTIPRLMAVL